MQYVTHADSPTREAHEERAETIVKAFPQCKIVEVSCVRALIWVPDEGHHELADRIRARLTAARLGDHFVVRTGRDKV